MTINIYAENDSWKETSLKLYYTEGNLITGFFAIVDRTDEQIHFFSLVSRSAWSR